MAFKLGDLLIKEIMYGYASEIGTGIPLYVLTQLSSAEISVSAESNDIVDKNGNLVKRIYKSKSGELAATNAFVNANIIEAASGSKADFAMVGHELEFPKILVAKPSTTEKKSTVTITGYVEGTLKVNYYYGDGTMGDAVEDAESMVEEDVLTLPEDAGDADAFIIRYTRKLSEGAIIQNRSDKFPNSVNLLLKCKYYDPCAKNTVKALYVECPSFQVSPETSLSLSSDSTEMDFNGSLEIDYCGIDKVLYNVYIPNEDDDDGEE